jgi:hypothetical protein
MDPAGYAAGEMSLYSALSNNPVLWVDQTGLSVRDVVIGMLASAWVKGKSQGVSQNEFKYDFQLLNLIKCGFKIGINARLSTNGCVAVSVYGIFFGQADIPLRFIVLV